jgi:lambda family phage portal protein
MATAAAKPRIRVRADGTIPAGQALVGYSGRAYDAARSDTRELQSWQPSLSSGDSEALGGAEMIRKRARDMDRNNGWLNGGLDTRTDAVIGAKIRLEARPDFEAMGRTPEWAEAWAVKAEAEFRIWANDARFLCDVERDFQFGGLVRLAYLQFAREGETAAIIYDLPRGGTYKTSVLVLDVDRISNRDNASDTDRRRGGVHLDQNGAAIAYDVRSRHPNDVSTSAQSFVWTTIPREGRTGRPRFIHVKNKRRPQQTRGVSQLAASLKRFKMLERYDNAELEAALWNAINAFVIQSPFTGEEVTQAFAPIDDGEGGATTYADQLIDFREKKKVTIGDGVQALHLFPGEKGEMLSAERPATNFAAFESAVLRSLAGQFKLSYQQLSQDWASINYSSARTLLNETWRGLMADRHLFTQAFCTPIYAAWLEEAVSLGRVKIPGGAANFYRWRAALTMAEWIGPGRGSIDPQKEANAGDMNLAANRQSLQMQCAEQGVDHRDVALQRAREIAMHKRLGLPEPKPVQAGASDDPDEADRNEERAAA